MLLLCFFDLIKLIYAALRGQSEGFESRFMDFTKNLLPELKSIAKLEKLSLDVNADVCLLLQRLVPASLFKYAPPQNLGTKKI